MSELWLSFLLSFGAVALMLLLHAFLVVFEISVVKLRYGEVDEEEVTALKSRPAIAKFLDNGDVTGRLVRFSKTSCTVAVGLLLLPLVSDLFELVQPTLAPDRWLVVLLSFILAVLAHFFFAEIFPRGIAMKNPAGGIRRSYKVLVAFQIVTLPAMLFFRRLKELLYRRLGVDVEDELNPLDVDVQIRAMGEESGELSPLVRQILERTLQMRELVVQDILLPRSQVVIYDLEESFSENLERMKQAGHTRFPLCRGDLDDCVGILHIKDIFRLREALDAVDPLKLKRNVAVFSVETHLEEALQRMLRAKFHMALAVDEFGGAVGVITLESILEELVGEIQDEFDSEEDQIVPLEERPGRFRISGLTPIHDIEEQLKIEIENEEVSTFGGLITAEMGRIPNAGDSLEAYGLRIAVTDVNERRVIATEVEILENERSGAEDDSAVG